MTRLICIAFAFAVIGCATGKDALQEPSSQSANAEGRKGGGAEERSASPKAQPQPEATFRISMSNPGMGWTASHNVMLPTGDIAALYLKHKTGERVDGVVFVMIIPAEIGDPKAAATLSRADDDRLGAVVSEVSCDKEVQPQRCEYQAFGQSPTGQTSVKAVFRAMKGMKETVAVVGVWPTDNSAAMLKIYETLANSLKVTANK